mmetsp:Transcript_96383/g.234253  ORF Transcript_96383/g.234253 Transcript_96383/m.234253 type:complete len:153 (+) Transcript_96383:3-461(+)
MPLLPGVGGHDALKFPPAVLLANASPGYAGHVPGRQSENIHGLSFRDANEHAIAEVHAQSAGLRAAPPCNLWATSSGAFPGLVPCKRSGRHTLDKITKPYRNHSEPARKRGLGPAESAPAFAAPWEKPAGVKNIWVGNWSPSERCSKWRPGQ